MELPSHRVQRLRSQAERLSCMQDNRRPVASRTGRAQHRDARDGQAAAPLGHGPLDIFFLETRVTRFMYRLQYIR